MMGAEGFPKGVVRSCSVILVNPGMLYSPEPRDVLLMVVRQGAFVAFTGIGIGIAVALAVTRSLSYFLFGVSLLGAENFVYFTRKGMPWQKQGLKNPNR